MSRSIHATWAEWRAVKYVHYADEEVQEKRMASIANQVFTKRRIKARVRSDRARPPLADLPPLDPDALPIEVVNQADWIHYPASPDDIRAVLRRLHPATFTGLRGIRLCLGPAPRRQRASRSKLTQRMVDPWLGRYGHELIPGVFVGSINGTYYQRRPDITLHAYLYDRELPDREMWEVVFRFLMLEALVHELAHHDDWMRRVARGRWRMDVTHRGEAYAEAEAARMVTASVVPYLYEAYEGALLAFASWAFATPPPTLISEKRLHPHVQHGVVELYRTLNALGLRPRAPEKDAASGLTPP
jgi:hypothetical protein